MKRAVYFVNAHPDDLIACMGLAMRLGTDERYAVKVIDATHGERGLMHKNVPMEECAALRDKEEEQVCGAMGLKPFWLDEIDGEACASHRACQKLAEMFMAEPPRAIITQWPVDRHVDHMVAATIAMNALRMAEGVIGGKLYKDNAEVYFYAYASNSIGFVPTHFFPMDEAMMDRKCELVSLYACQNGPGLARQDRLESAINGCHARCAYAEAYAAFQVHVPGHCCLFDELS